MKTDLSTLLKASKEIKKAGTFSGYPLQDRKTFRGLNISIENKKGSNRHWTDNQGKKGTTKMLYDYGYIRGTEGVDGDHIDVYLGPDIKAPFVYVVHQNDPVTGKYDEDKVMLGFINAGEAKKAYLKHYDDIKFFGGIKALSFEKFKEKVFKILHGKKKSLKAEIHKAFSNSKLVIRKRG